MLYSISLSRIRVLGSTRLILYVKVPPDVSLGDMDVHELLVNLWVIEYSKGRWLPAYDLFNILSIVKKGGIISCTVPESFFYDRDIKVSINFPKRLVKSVRKRMLHHIPQRLTYI